jgi:hypothetical protein
MIAERARFTSLRGRNVKLAQLLRSLDRDRRVHLRLGVDVVAALLAGSSGLTGCGRVVDRAERSPPKCRVQRAELNSSPQICAWEQLKRTTTKNTG